jgi:biopolymer transport protein ExbD
MNSPELEKGIERNKRNRVRWTIIALVSIAILLLVPRLLRYHLMQEYQESILQMPMKIDQPIDSAQSFMTVYITENKYFKLDGNFEEGVQASDFEEIQLSDNALKKSAESPAIIIKATRSSTYQSLVDLLETLAVNEYPRYAIDPMSQAEIDLIPE